MHAATLQGRESSTRPVEPVVRRGGAARRRRMRRGRAGGAAGARAVTRACPACASPVRGAVRSCAHCGAYIGSHERRAMDAGRRLVRRYQLGMKVLGAALTVIGALVTVLGAIVGFLLAAWLTPPGGGVNPVWMLIPAAVLALGGLQLWLGFCALRLRGWVNRVTILYCALALLGTALVTVNSGELRVSFGALLDLGVLALAVVNAVNLARIREQGLDPRRGALTVRMRSPRARSRR